MHYQSQQKAGTKPAVLEPYVLDESDIQYAQQLGPDVFGRWSFVDKMPQAAADPCVYSAVTQV